MTDDIERRLSYNTAISAIMELANELSRDTSDPAARFAAETAVSLIQPYAPHIAEELWQALGHEERLWKVAWPVADEAMLERDTFELVVQVNGRVRDRFDVPASLSDDELVERGEGVGEGAGPPRRRQRSGRRSSCPASSSTSSSRRLRGRCRLGAKSGAVCAS